MAQQRSEVECVPGEDFTEGLTVECSGMMRVEQELRE